MNFQKKDARTDSLQFFTDPKITLSFTEFVAIIALMMALTALSIDIMLPALPEIGEALGVADPNDRQTVVIIYMFGFAAGQLIYGPLSDRYGRKPVLLAGLVIFIAGSIGALLASSFAMLLAARVVQGIGAASPRVMAMAIVRDIYSGRQMAKVMSFAMMVFIVIPVFAPAVGQGLMWAGSWRWTFDALLIAGILCAVWASWRLPETAATKGRTPLKLGPSLRLALTTPQTVGIHGCRRLHVRLPDGLREQCPAGVRRRVSARRAVSNSLRRRGLRHGARRVHERQYRRAARNAARLAHGFDGLRCRVRLCLHLRR